MASQGLPFTRSSMNQSPLPAPFKKGSKSPPPKPHKINGRISPIRPFSKVYLQEHLPLSRWLPQHSKNRTVTFRWTQGDFTLQIQRQHVHWGFSFNRESQCASTLPACR